MKIYDFYKLKMNQRIKNIVEPKNLQSEVFSQHVNSKKVDAGNAGNAGMPEPLPLKNDELPPPSRLRREMLPKSIRRYVLETAYSLDNTAPDFIAVSTISMLAAIIGSNVVIKPKKMDDWCVPCVIWTLLVGKASEKKTPSISKVKSFVDTLIKNKFKPQISQKMTSYESLYRIYDRKKKVLEKKLDGAFEGDDDEKVNEIQIEMENLSKPEKPILREIFVNDATIEALIMALENNPSGILMLRDELSGLIATFEQQARSHERSVYLEGFNGSRGGYIVRRVGRDDVELSQMFISLLGGIQPDMLKPLILQALSGGRNDGFLERCLQMSVYPMSAESKVTDHLVTESDKNKVKHLFLVLSKLDCPYHPLQLSFDYSAQKKWDKWSKEALEDQRRAPSELESFCAKRIAHCAKLALIFHLIEEASKADDNEDFTPCLKIGVESINRAMVWMRYLKTHAERIMLSGQTQSISNSPAKILMSRLNKLYPFFTKHQLSQKGWKSLKSSDQRDEALEVLENNGYIQKSKMFKGHDGDGHKQVLGYFVHPNYSQIKN